MKRNDLLALIKKTVQKIEPGADLILYGSRARGDAVPDSDWDFLILVDGEVNTRREDRICHQIYEIEWTNNEILTPFVYSRTLWNSDLYQMMPFHENVEREGILL